MRTLKEKDKKSIMSTDYILTFLILFVPYGLICFLAFRFLRNDIRTVLHYSFVALLFLVGLIVYFVVASSIVDCLVNKHVSNLVVATVYATVI